MDTFASIPLLNRDMLRWGRSMSIELIINNKASVNDSSGLVSVNVITKSSMITIPLTLNNAVSQTTITRKLDDIPLMICAQTQSAGINVGECFVSCSLRINGQAVYNLCSGLVYENKGVSWPINNSEVNFPFPGAVNAFNSADPAAGAEISYTTTTVRSTELIALSFTLVTAVAAANRRVHLQISYATGEMFDFVSNVDQAASLTRHYTATGYPTGLAEAAGSEIHIPIPYRFFMPPGTTIATLTDNLQAADNFGVASMDLIQYLYDSGG